MDITYVLMARGFVYLVAVLDWFSRKVLAWRLSTTLETGPFIKALKDAMRRHGKPEIMNSEPMVTPMVRVTLANAGQPIHIHRLHQNAKGCRHPDQHLW